MTSFLSQVATDLLQKHPDLKDLCIIMPSRRAAVFLKKELSGQLVKPVWSPEITTIEDFMLDSLELEQGDRPTLIFRLYESYTEVATEPRESFAEFSQWAHLLLSDFNEIDRYLVDARQLFGYLADVERIKKWDLQGGEMSEMLKNYLRMWEMLPELYQHFYQRLLADKIVYQGIAYREMAGQLEQKLAVFKQQYQKLVFIGFNALNTAEEKILTQLYREGLAEFYWDVDDYYFEDSDQEAGHFLRESKLVRELIDRDDFKWRHKSLSRSPKEIDIVGVSGNHLQAVAANAAVLKLKDENIEDVAVALADEELLPVFLNNIADEVESLNITMGLPLKSTPAAGFFDLLISMLREQEMSGRKDKSGNPAFHHQKWDDLLGHFLCKLWAGNPGAMEKLRSEIRKRNWVYLSASNLAEWMPEAMHEDIRSFFTEVAEQEIWQSWEQLAQLSEKLNEKTSEHHSLLQSLFGFFKLFNRLTDLMKTYPFVKDWQTAQRFYRDLIAQESLDLTGDPLSGLQVMGMLETRSLDFKHLILTSLNEDVLPKGRSDNSLIPFDIKREFGLPTYLEKDAVFAYHFYRLLQRAEKITLIYNATTEGLRTGEPSRFINQLLFELREANRQAVIRERKLSVPISIENSNEEIQKTPAVMQRLHEMAERGFSPTALTDYVNDPVEFYKKRVLNLQEAEDVEEVAGYDTQGNVVHGLLEDFYSFKDGDQKRVKFHLDPLDEVFAQTEGQVRDLVVERLQKESGLSDLNHGKNLVIREILTGMIFNFLKKEKEELEFLNGQGRMLSLLGLEQKLDARIGISGGRQVKIRGIVDRVDRVGDQVRVVDYKTGAVDRAGLKLKNMQDLRQPLKWNKSLQLLTYAWLYLKNNHEVDNVAPGIISLRDVWSWLLALQFDKSRQIDRQVTEEFEDFLKSLLEEIFNPEIPFSKKLLTLQSDE